MAERIEYSLVACAATGKYGIMALEKESGAWALAYPFSDDKKRIDELVGRLDRDQTSLEAFEEAFLRGELP